MPVKVMERPAVHPAVVLATLGFDRSVAEGSGYQIINSLPRIGRQSYDYLRLDMRV